MAGGRLQLCLLLVVISLGLCQAEKCTSVSDVLPQLPADLQALVKDRIDVYSFKGTVFLPTEEAWRTRDLDSRLYGKKTLETILGFSIVGGVRLASRPRADLKTGTIQLDTLYKDDPTLICLTGDRPDAELDVDIIVQGNPNPNDTARFNLEGTPGNTLSAGSGNITIVKVYSDKKSQTAMTNETQKDATRDWDEKKFNETLRKAGSWEPANVVKVVQCENVDVFFVDEVLMPCPMCGKKCTALIIDKIVMVMLPVTTVFAVALAIGGYIAICCGCNLCAGASGVCGCFWKCVCRSLVLIVVLVELLVASAFIGYAYYFSEFGKENRHIPGVEKWRPYLIWSILGAVLTGVVVITQVWAFISQARKRNEHKRHKQFQSAPPPPMYATAGIIGPMRA